MKKKFNFNNIPSFSDQFQQELEKEITSFFADEMKSVNPDEFIRKKIIGFAASMKSVRTRFCSPCEVILN